MALKTLTVKFNADTTGFQKGLKTVNSGLASMRGNVSGLIKGALGIAGVATGIKAVAEAFKAYVGLESSVSRTNDLFKDSAKYIKYFAENTGKSFGMAESSAYQYAAIYGNLTKGITKNSAENAKVTIAMLKASAVVASKTGRTMEDVMDRIRSGLLGNTEAIEDLGIYAQVGAIEATDAFKKIAKGRSWEKLNYQEQQQIRVLSILEQAHSQFGDTVQKGSAYSLSVLSGVFKDLMATAGGFINAALMPIVSWLIKIVQWATAGLKALAALFGVNVSGDISAASGSLSSGAAAAADTSDALGDATKNAKKLKNQLAGFDQFNDITPTASGSGAAGGAGSSAGAGGASVFDGIAAPEYGEVTGPNLTWVKTAKEKYNELLDTFKNSSAAQDVRFIFGEIEGITLDVWKNVRPNFEAGFSNLFSGLRALGSTLWKDIVTGLGSDLLNVLAGWFSEKSTTIQSELAAILNNIFAGAFSAGNVFGNLSGIISDALAGSKPAILNAFHDLVSAAYSVFSTYSFIISDAFSRIWNFIDAWVAEKKGELTSALTNTWISGASTVSVFSSIIEDTFLNLKDFWTQWGGDILNIILAPLKSLGNMILEAWNNFVLPVWAEIIGWLKKIWEESLSGLVGEALGFIGRIAEVFGLMWGFLGPILENSWQNIISGFRVAFNTVLNIVMPIVQNLIDQVRGIIKALNGVLDFIIGVFTGDWGRAWQGVKDVFEGIWDGIKATFKMVFNVALGAVEGFINAAISMINTFIRAVNLAIQTINTIPGINIPKLGTIQDVKLPRLAKGAMAYGEIQAIIGDNFNARQDPEVVAPLSNLKNMILEALVQKDIAAGGDKHMQITLELENGEALVDILIDPMNKKARNLGFAPVFKPST